MADHPFGDVTRPHHVALSVEDIDASTQWYEEKLDAEVTKKWRTPAGPEVRFVAVGGFIFEMVQVAESEPSPIQWLDPREVASIRGELHVAFSVENCDDAHSALEARGVKFVRPPVTIEPLGVRCAHFWDPDGNDFEIVEELAP